MNNNRGNNRRRGRGNNRPQGGGQQLNRIDSRARGNAPQLLEKYRKLAHDAHLNGDRVTAEYYLQFADHYFRVIADTRLRQEEARARREDRWQDGPDSFREEGEDGQDFSMEGDFPSFDQPPVYSRREREDRGRDTRRGEERPAREEAEEAVRVEDEAGAGEAGDPRSIYEPAENPFLRESRKDHRGPRQRRDERRPRREERREERAAEPREAAEPAETARVATSSPVEAPAPTALDPTSLPPPISPRRKSAATATDAVAEDAPAPKRRTRRKPASDAGETLESIG